MSLKDRIRNEETIGDHEFFEVEDVKEAVLFLKQQLNINLSDYGRNKIIDIIFGDFEK